MVDECRPGCIRKSPHKKCTVAPLTVRGPQNIYARHERAARDDRLAASPPPKGDPIEALHEAARRVAMADLAYHCALHHDSPLEARRILYTTCIPARQAYRAALDHASRHGAPATGGGP